MHIYSEDFVPEWALQLHISTLFASQVIPWSSVHDHVNSPLKPTIPHKL